MKGLGNLLPGSSGESSQGEHLVSGCSSPLGGRESSRGLQIRSLDSHRHVSSSPVPSPGSWCWKADCVTRPIMSLVSDGLNDAINNANFYPSL